MSQNKRSPHPQALPQYDRAEIRREKLEGYALNLAHPDGKHKALVFKSALGLEQDDWQWLQQQIIAELPYHEAIPKYADKHGERYEVLIPVTGKNGKIVLVATGWIIKRGTDYPYLTTAYIR